MKETYDSENNLSTKKNKFSETQFSSNFPSFLFLLLDLVIETAAREPPAQVGCSLHHTTPSPYPLITSPGGRNFLAEGGENFRDKKRQPLCWAAVWGGTPGSVAWRGEVLCCTCALLAPAWTLCKLAEIKPGNCTDPGCYCVMRATRVVGGSIPIEEAADNQSKSSSRAQ